MPPTAAAGGVPHRRVLDLLGLSARAGTLVTGTESVRQAVREERVHRVFLAEDAAPGQRRSPVSAVGITDSKLARRLGEMARALPQSRPAAEP